jgi:hypothetical protein
MELSHNAKFAIVYGQDEQHASFFPSSRRPTKATSATKIRALMFLAERPVAGLGNVEFDLRNAIDVARRVQAQRRSILYVGPGYQSTSEPTVSADRITAFNHGTVTINTIGIAPYASSEILLQRVAWNNRGTYKRVQ